MRNGNVFVGTQGGKGISLFDRKTRLFQHFNIRSVRKKSDNNIAVLTLTKNKKGQLIFGTYGDGLFVFDPISEKYRQLMQGPDIYDLNSNFIFCIKPDRDGKLWVGTNGDGLNVLDQQFKVIARYTTAIENFPMINYYPLMAISGISSKINLETYGSPLMEEA